MSIGLQSYLLKWIHMIFEPLNPTPVPTSQRVLGAALGLARFEEMPWVIQFMPDARICRLQSFRCVDAADSSMSPRGLSKEGGIVTEVESVGFWALGGKSLICSSLLAESKRLRLVG